MAAETSDDSLDLYFQQQKTITLTVETKTIPLSQSLVQRLVDGLDLTTSVPDLLQQIQNDVAATIDHLSLSDNYDDLVLAGRLLAAVGQRTLAANALTEYSHYTLFQSSTTLLSTAVRQYLLEQDWWNRQLALNLTPEQIQRVYRYLWRQLGAKYPLETISLLFLRLTAVLTAELPELSPQIYYYLNCGLLQLPPSILVSTGTNLGTLPSNYYLTTPDILATFCRYQSLFRRPLELHLLLGQVDNLQLLDSNLNLIDQFNLLLPATSLLYLSLEDKYLAYLNRSGLIWLDTGYSTTGNIAEQIQLLASHQVHLFRRPFVPQLMTQTIVLDVGRLYSIPLDNMFNIIRQLGQALAYVDDQSVVRQIKLVNWTLDNIPAIVFNLWLGNMEMAISSQRHAGLVSSWVQLPTVGADDVDFVEPGSWAQFKIVTRLTQEQIIGWADLQRLIAKYGLSYMLTISLDLTLNHETDLTLIQRLGRYLNLDLTVINTESNLCALSAIWSHEYLASIKFVSEA